jgi:hypothetical protein
LVIFWIVSYLVVFPGAGLGLWSSYICLLSSWDHKHALLYLPHLRDFQMPFQNFPFCFIWSMHPSCSAYLLHPLPQPTLWSCLSAPLSPLHEFLLDLGESRGYYFPPRRKETEVILFSILNT